MKLWKKTKINKHKAKKPQNPKPKEKKTPNQRQTTTIHTDTKNLTSLSLSLRVFLNSCCSNTAPEFTLGSAASPSSIMAQQHHPKTEIAQKNKKKWKQISTLTSKFTYSLGSKVELLLPLLLLVLLSCCSSSSSSSSAMDSSSITNTNKRRQQNNNNNLTTKEEQIPPCTNKQTQQKKNAVSLQKLQVLHQHQILTPILTFWTISFAELQVLHQHNCMKFFWEQQNTSISHVPNWKFVGTTKYQQKTPLLPNWETLSYLPTKVLLFLHAGNLFARPRGNPFASPRGNWECSHLLPPLPKHLWCVHACMHSHLMLSRC